MEVIVCSVQSSVALRAKGSSKDDEIFRDGRVNDVHSTHGTSSVVKDPFRGVGIYNNDIRGSGVGCGEVRHDVLDHAIQVIGMCGNGVFCDLVKKWWVEDIPLVLDRKQVWPSAFRYEAEKLTLMLSSQPNVTYRTATTISRNIHFFAHPPNVHEVVWLAACVGDFAMIFRAVVSSSRRVVRHDKYSSDHVPDTEIEDEIKVL